MGKDAIELCRLSNGTKAYLKMNSPGQILKDKGLTSNGGAQAFHTQNVLRRITRYMPMVSGATIKVAIAQTNINKPQIVVDVPYAKYLYYGKVMVGKAPKVATTNPLQYTLTKNPRAGPFWDRTLSAAEGLAIAADLQRYIRRRGT